MSEEEEEGWEEEGGRECVCEWEGGGEGWREGASESVSE